MDDLVDVGGMVCGDEEFGEFLGKNDGRTMAVLQVWGCELQRGVGIARAMCSGGLRELHASGNRLGQDGIHLIADSLRENKTLRVLDLARNRITDRGAFAIAEALKGNNVLQYLNLYGNDIGLEGEAALKEGWGAHPRAGPLLIAENRGEERPGDGRTPPPAPPLADDYTVVVTPKNNSIPLSWIGGAVSALIVGLVFYSKSQ